MNFRRQLLLNVVFWLLAAAVLFLNAWPKARSHIEVAYVRYAYFVVVGLLASGAMVPLYASDWFARQRLRLVWVTIFSVLAALVTSFMPGDDLMRAAFFFGFRLPVAGTLMARGSR